MKTFENKELVAALGELEKERGIQKEYLLESLETALVTAYKRNFDAAENVRVEINDKTGEIKIYALKEVTKKIEDKMLQISLEEAKKINKKIKEGEIIEIEKFPKEFGRISAQTAKQVIVQKIREAEREMTFNEYNERKGDIVNGIVQKADGGVVVLDLGKLEGIMPLKNQIPTEKYRVNEKIKTYVVNVEKGIKGTQQVLVSRSHPNFIKKLLEFEIPEIYEGLIEIKSIARDPGYRSKVAVYSINENIDPVGSCVGQKGVRIQNVINELKGEKIDIIEWDPEITIFISSALLPAQVMAVDIKEEENFAQVIVPDDQLSLAIGKAGQNARLAAKLTGWKIDIKSETQFREYLESLNENVQEESEEIEEIEEEVEQIKEIEEKTNEPEAVKEVKRKKEEKVKKEDKPEEVKKAKTKKEDKVKETKKVEKVKKEDKPEEVKKAKTKKEDKVKKAPKKETKKTVSEDNPLE